MSESLLETALSPEILDAAWRRLKRDRTLWQTGLSRGEMERHQLRHLIELRDAVLNGDYRPEPLRRFTLKKASGGQRVLSALHLRDKLLQRAVLSVLDPIAEQIFHHDSYAYRRGRGVDGAINKANEHIRCGEHWLVDADIQGFFDHVDHAILERRLKQHISDRKMLALLNQWIDNGASQKSLFGRAQGIPQGAILSPLLCNLYLNDFDQQLTKTHIPFVRYADDFLLFAPNERKAEKALRFAQQQLKRCRLKLNFEKTRIVHAKQRPIFLGKRLRRPPKSAGDKR